MGTSTPKKMQSIVTSLLSLLSVIAIVSARFRVIEPPADITNCFNEKRFHSNATDPLWDCSHSWCIQKFRWHMARMLWQNISSETTLWVDELLRMTEGDRRHKRQAEPLRVRQEYRRLTNTERENYHRAIQMLKADTSVHPNRYDTLGRLHQRLGDDIHHGAAFLGWHRVFLVIYENALRQKVPSVILPYWDSRMDERLANPTLSVMWTQDFIGNGFGRVVNGPFAYWQTPSGPLMRNIGQEGQLFSNRQTTAILTRVRMSDITEPYAVPPFDFEIRHGEVHKWIGGTMAPAEHSAYDPVFYLHHAFVDYLWELFRVNQRRAGVNPTIDYPPRFGPQAHSPTGSMSIGKLQNIHGLSDVYTSQIYTYENSPTCTYQRTSCGSQYLRCEVRFGSPNCVSVTAAEARVRTQSRTGSSSRSSSQTGTSARARAMLPSSPQRQGRSRPSNVWNRRSSQPLPSRSNNNRQMSQPPTNFFNRVKRSLLTDNDARNELQAFHGMGEICPVRQPPRVIQNMFELNGLADIRVWVYIPVQVIYKRNPKIQKFNAFPIQNAQMIDNVDLYDPTQYESLRHHFIRNNVKRTRQCKEIREDSVFMKTMIHSDGLNYHGMYRDFVLLDARQPFSSSVAYIAVKSPENYSTEVILTAYDQCGKVCTPYCRESGSYIPCSGAIKITSNPPKLYGRDYGEAVQLVWNLSGEFPVMNEDNISVRFLC